jgi:hypothetical protein
MKSLLLLSIGNIQSLSSAIGAADGRSVGNAQEGKGQANNRVVRVDDG